MSDFGPANAVGGVWECPDLFPLAVDGDPTKTKWVMVVNLNPGGIQGGSAGQYFVGDFDGTRFTADDVAGPYTPPAGDVFQDFEGATYDGWTTTGNAFGDGPAQGNVPPQGGVTGYQSAAAWPTASIDEDGGTGTLTSPEFTITRDYVNFLVGGGEHAYDPTSRRRPAARRPVLADFEGDTYGALDGDRHVRRHAPAGRHDRRPERGHRLRGPPAREHVHRPRQRHRAHHLTRVHDHHGLHQLPRRRRQPPLPGTATNKPVRSTWSSTAPSCAPRPAATPRRCCGPTGTSRRCSGKTARIDIVDENTGGWGHILADHFTLADTPARSRARPRPRSTCSSTARSCAPPPARTARRSTGASWNVSSSPGKHRPDPDRRPQHRRLGAHPRRPVHVRRRSGAVAAGPRAAGSTTARTTTPPCPGTTRPAASGS